MTFYHYCCEHSAQVIDEMDVPAIRSLLDVAPTTAMPYEYLRDLWSLAWFTDLDVPDARGLGLTRRMLACDRTKFRYRVLPEDEGLLVRWPQYRREHPSPMWSELESSGGAMPAHWWVSTVPVRVEAA